MVAPHDGHENVRLVSTPGAQSDQDSEGVSLDLTVAEISAHEPIQESAYLGPGELVGGGSDWDVGVQEMYALPDAGSLGPEMLGAGMAMEYDQHVAVTYHRVPKGCVELRRASPVTSADGHHLGHVVGFVIDDQEQIEQMVLEHGHLWGKRMVAIPGRAIQRLETDAVTLSLTSDEVGDEIGPRSSVVELSFTLTARSEGGPRPGVRIRTSVLGHLRSTASANARAGATGSNRRCAPHALSVPQWIGTAIRGRIRATASAARTGSRCPAGTRAPQPQIGSRATSTRPASADIPENRSVSPAK